jgi:hypothetical protein
MNSQRQVEAALLPSILKSKQFLHITGNIFKIQNKTVASINGNPTKKGGRGLTQFRRNSGHMYLDIRLSNFPFVIYTLQVVLSCEIIPGSLIEMHRCFREMSVIFCLDYSPSHPRLLMHSHGCHVRGCRTYEHTVWRFRSQQHFILRNHVMSLTWSFHFWKKKNRKK